MFTDFTTTTHGKWILCGEHAVIRGHAALAFPLQNKTLAFSYKHSREPLTVNARYLNRTDAEINTVIYQVIAHALRQVNLKINDVTGHIEINSNIAAGQGMGASAALCVAIAKWLQNSHEINGIYEFAKNSENYFHGQSSGLDIAAVESDAPIIFQNHHYEPLAIKWQPKWQISFCGETASTASCIEKVAAIWQKTPDIAQSIDKKMQSATTKAQQALQNSSKDAIKDLITAINTAKECFQDWGLITSSMQEHLTNLQQQGALAAKPTGSGGGGLALSLWP